MYHISVTLLLRCVSVTHLYLYGISLLYVRHMKAYVSYMCENEAYP